MVDKYINDIGESGGIYTEQGNQDSTVNRAVPNRVVGGVDVEPRPVKIAPRELPFQYGNIEKRIPRQVKRNLKRTQRNVTRTVKRSNKSTMDKKAGTFLDTISGNISVGAGANTNKVLLGVATVGAILIGVVIAARPKRRKRRR